MTWFPLTGVFAGLLFPLHQLVLRLLGSVFRQLFLLALTIAAARIVRNSVRTVVQVSGDDTSTVFAMLDRQD